jgi:hypothetical protein
MKIEFSFFSNNKSLIGFEIERSGRVKRGDDDMPAFQRTIEISIGFLFSYITLHFNLGSAVSLEKIITEHNELLENADN